MRACHVSPFMSVNYGQLSLGTLQRQYLWLCFKKSHISTFFFTQCFISLFTAAFYVFVFFGR